MSKKSFFLRVFGAAILVLVGLLLGLGIQERLCYNKLQDASLAPQAPLGQERSSQSASVMIDADKDILAFPGIKIEAGDTVWSVLERLAKSQGEKLKVESQDYGDMGILVTAINGVKGGEDNKYWQYWVNNEYAQVSADKQAVRAGDVIMWKFTGSEFREY